MTWLYEWLFEPLFISAQRTLSFNNDTTFSNLYILLLSAVSLTFINFFFFVRRLFDSSFNRSIIKRQTPACLIIISIHLSIYLYIYLSTYILPVYLLTCVPACLLFAYLSYLSVLSFSLSFFRCWIISYRLKSLLSYFFSLVFFLFLIF